MWSLVLEKMKFHHMINKKRENDEPFHGKEDFGDEEIDAISGKMRWFLRVLANDFVVYRCNSRLNLTVTTDSMVTKHQKISSKNRKILLYLHERKYWRKLFHVWLTCTFARDICYCPHTLVTTYGSNTKVDIFSSRGQFYSLCYCFNSA